MDELIDQINETARQIAQAALMMVFAIARCVLVIILLVVRAIEILAWTLAAIARVAVGFVPQLIRALVIVAWASAVVVMAVAVVMLYARYDFTIAGLIAAVALATQIVLLPQADDGLGGYGIGALTGYGITIVIYWAIQNQWLGGMVIALLPILAVARLASSQPQKGIDHDNFQQPKQLG